jgi:hypothetical protein
MKINFKEFFKNPAKAFKQLLENGKEVVSGKKPHLSYQRLESKYQRVRFGEHANAAGARRFTRDQVWKGIRRNTRGLPVGFSWQQFSRMAGQRGRKFLKALGSVLRFDPSSKTWKREPHLFAQQAESAREAFKVGSELRKTKPSKLSRWCSRRARLSCNPTKATLDIMERRDLLGRGTDRLGIPRTAYVKRSEHARLKNRVLEDCQNTVNEQNPTMTRRERRALARNLAKTIYANMRGMQPIH